MKKKKKKKIEDKLLSYGIRKITVIYHTITSRLKVHMESNCRDGILLEGHSFNFLMFLLCVMKSRLQIGR